MAASARAFLCECGARGCRAEARLTEAEYSELRERGLKLVSTAAHDLAPGIVVGRGPGWAAIGRRRRPAGRRPGAPVRPELVIRRCPTCQAETVLADDGSCLWCSTRIEAAA